MAIDQAVLPFDELGMPTRVKRTVRSERHAWRHYIVGGGEWSGWIDPASVPLCAHDHAEVEEDLAASLQRYCLVRSLFRRHCLLSEWDGAAAETECLVYPVGEFRQRLWVNVLGPDRDGDLFTHGGVNAASTER